MLSYNDQHYIMGDCFMYIISIIVNRSSELDDILKLRKILEFVMQYNRSKCVVKILLKHIYIHIPKDSKLSSFDYGRSIIRYTLHSNHVGLLEENI